MSRQLDDSDEALLQAALSSFRIFLRRAELQTLRLQAECSRAEWEACRLAEEKRERRHQGSSLEKGNPGNRQFHGGSWFYSATKCHGRSNASRSHNWGSPTAPSPIIAREPFVASEEDSRISRHWEDIHLVDSSFLSLPEIFPRRRQLERALAPLLTDYPLEYLNLLHLLHPSSAED
ncbi:hypothetical protein BS47DRAFT_1490486 [Hydnum rufescens UP504]|uniref:Uncharacterized protein n=1 Tax=Hydnum rufescens UP504 TaxID=1448309 RepID=A0A9P6AD68_9AGAM|nr:hypothetical protein BS47DRAFT_1490486 [Hydnum rufescens UP504]